MEEYTKRLMHDRTHNCVNTFAGIACYQEGDELWVKEYHHGDKREGRTYKVNYCPMCGNGPISNKVSVGQEPFSKPEDRYFTCQERDIISNLLRSSASSLDNPAFLYEAKASKTLVMMELSLTMEKVFSWDYWRDLIPYLSFPDNWEVQIIPPFSGAIVRFRVCKKGSDHWVSIYLDCYDVLGCYNGPYWEIYPYKCDIYRVPISDSEELIKRIEEALSEESIREYQKRENKL